MCFMFSKVPCLIVVLPKPNIQIVDSHWWHREGICAPDMAFFPGYQVSPKPNRRIIVSGCSSASSPCFGACLPKINSDARRKVFGLGRDLLLWTSVFWAHIFCQALRLYTIRANPFLTHPAHPVEFALPQCSSGPTGGTLLPAEQTLSETVRMSFFQDKTFWEWKFNPPALDLN